MLIYDQVDFPHHNNNAPKLPNTQPVSDQTLDYLSCKPSFRVYTKAETNCSLTIRDGQVILARFDPSDPFQHWVKDERYSTEVEDEYGFPSFSMVNKATGQALKHSVGAHHPVQLIPYVPDILDESVLWTLGEDLGDGYRAMRMASNAHLNVDAFQNSNECVHDGAIVGLCEWLEGENQQWKLVPHQDGSSSIHNQTHQVWDYLGRMPSIRVYTKAETNCSLTIRDGQVILAQFDPSDPFQHWVKDERYSTEVKDEYGFPSFSMVNKATGQALKHSVGAHHPVQLIPYVPDILDESLLWTLGEELGDGYSAMRMASNTHLNLDAFQNSNECVNDGTIVGLCEWLEGENQQWKIVPHQDGPSSIHMQTHQVWDYLGRMPSVMVYTMAETNCSLAIRDGQVILARFDPSDPFQHWVKDERYSTEVKDEYGFPSFSMVNKATGQALKHSVGAHHPVQLIPYVPDILDESLLWTLGEDLGDGYSAMRMASNTHLNVDAFQNSNGCVNDGTIVGLCEWLEGENQQWKIVPHQDGPSSIHNQTHQVWDYLGRMPSVMVYTMAETNCSLAIRDGQVILARFDPSDPFQHWVKDERYSTEVKDEYGFPSFSMVNKATGQALKHSVGAHHPVQLIPYVPDILDESLLWTLGEDLGDGYSAMRMASNTHLNVDAFQNSNGCVNDGTIVGLCEWLEGENQQWKIVPHQDGPSSIHNQTHQVWDYLGRMPSVMVYTMAETNCSLAIRDGQVILARFDPSDPFQHWVKDERYSTEVKDEYGFPSFSMVNKATGQALKHSVGAHHPVQLFPYVPDILDESLLWTLGEDLGDGYSAMRMASNTHLNVDAFQNSNGCVNDGTIVGLCEWLEGENQQWKIVPRQDGPSSIHKQTHLVWDYLGRMPSVMVYTMAETNCSLAIRDGQVILARFDPSDPFQHWVKDERYSTEVKDEYGFPSFSMVNKATGQALKHSVGAHHPVQLIPYVPDILDESVLWTLSADLGDGYRAMRTATNTHLNVDAFQDSDGCVHDGTIVGLWEWLQGENQRWKIVPHHDGPSIHNQTHQVWDYLVRMPSVRVYTKAETNCSLAIHHGKVILARADPSDPSQHWVKDEKYSTEVKDQYGFPSFSLVNKATGQIMKHSVGATHPVQLIPYGLIPYGLNVVDESVLWTLGTDSGDGYRAMRMVNNTRLNLDAFRNSNGRVDDGTIIGLWEWLKGENQQWKIIPY